MNAQATPQRQSPTLPVPQPQSIPAQATLEPATDAATAPHDLRELPGAVHEVFGVLIAPTQAHSVRTAADLLRLVPQSAQDAFEASIGRSVQGALSRMGWPLLV